MPRSCPKYLWAGRAVRSTGLATASARGAARVTEDASRSSQAAARATDGSVVANNGAAVFADVSLTERAAVMAATISICAARLAKPTHMARRAGFEEIEEWLMLGPSVAARVAYRSGVPWEGARPMVDAGDFGRADLGDLLLGQRPVAELWRSCGLGGGFSRGQAHSC